MNQKKTHSNFKPGDVLRVVHNKGIHAHVGQLAIVVAPDEFPSYFKTMLKSVDKEDLYQFFTTVRWVPSANYPNKPEDGFYSSARFEKAAAVFA